MKTPEQKAVTKKRRDEAKQQRYKRTAVLDLAELVVGEPVKGALPLPDWEDGSLKQQKWATSIRAGLLMLIHTHTKTWSKERRDALIVRTTCELNRCGRASSIFWIETRNHIVDEILKEVLDWDKARNESGCGAFLNVFC